MERVLWCCFRGGFLIMGTGLLLVVRQTLSTDWLPHGSNGLRGRVELRLSEQPFRYWIIFSGYSAAGIGWAIFALCLLIGHTQPLSQQ